MNKNKLMLMLASVVVLISILVHVIHKLKLISPMHGALVLPDYHSLVSTIVLVIPIILLIITSFYYVKKNDHNIIPLLITLTLTFASISTITGGGGMVEYHFSLFMVVAILAYYENIKLLFIMTSILVLQHLLGFFIPSFTVFVFGALEYSFSMLLLHAIFLAITTGATTWQILSKTKHTALLEKENENNQIIIEEIIKHLTDTSEKVLNTVKNLKDTSEESQLMSNQITKSIQHLKTDTDTQLTMAYESGKLLEEMTAGIQQIASSASIVVNASSQTTEEAKQGKEAVLETIDQIDVISHSFENLSDVIVNLEKRSSEINEIITVISDISSQTNLLALNAAIEAARAGEYGKGFAVVADEVRKLAEQSEQSVVKVGNLVKEIQTDTNTATKSMQTGTKEVKEGIRLVNQTGTVFERIIVSAEKAYKQIQETSTISDEIAASSEHVSTSMQNMTAVSKGTAESSDHISSATEKQQLSMETIIEIANSLNKLVDELNTLTLDLGNKS